ncbi:tRNA (N6-threonylcarbamoyladenosine(37)-N6)-methyltransferase TrmO [Methanofollis tationis]|uniref:tRNA (N6-threonylcarbamoyladenosine(37)-N6)-methyltransferase TrmO n=1 Tax=Methanofollis tationis TaxID=81417 RepID=A0A7K4HQ11_9EURY|nr:tRNA (N6-threonylcarbamoyladenosine(37)-N6)-methyltransferase TrmO [Methanofollis tationis]NVO67354.1 tRNA (N6-threonylcarbamoyladenosine(37)-N6)-methyltransferase TrmO [Methanofollis tationis]
MMELVQIGVIRSPYKRQGDAPRQGRLADIESEIEVFPEYLDGLADVERCSHLILLYWLDRADRTMLKAIPPGQPAERGVFSTRSPNRPNPIGFGVVDLVAVEGGTLRVRGLDAFDGTPLLDIKPYSSEVDAIPGISVGWMENMKRNPGT